MSRPCTCDRVRRGEAFDLGRDCRLCWLFEHDQRYRDRWSDGTAGSSYSAPGVVLDSRPPLPPPRLPCVREGAVLEFSRCRGEAGHVRDCDLHDLCVRGPRERVGPVAPHVRLCSECPDYVAAPPPPEVGATRHCLYFVCPLSGNGVWQSRVGHLVARSGLFNGRKIVAVASGSGGPRIDPVPDVAARFGPGWEVVPVANDRGRRETVAWEDLWGRLEGSCGPGDAAWFGHAKGVTKPVNDGVTCHPWARTATEVCLDYWPLVKEQLARFPITGPFKKLGAGFGGSRSTFHYSGTFYWVRLADFFARDWRGLLDKTWWGTESYPGVAYRQSEAGCLFHQAEVPVMNLYLMNYWRKVEKEYELWRVKNEAYRSVTGSLTV